MAYQIQLRRDSSSAWDNENPVLAQGELGYDLTNENWKAGDGTTAWQDLDFLIMQGETGVAGATGVQGIQGTTGVQGIQGTTGVQGIQGTTGVQGQTGVQGIQGITGLYGSKSISFAICDTLTPLRGATGIYGFCVPAELNGFNLVSANAAVGVVGATGWDFFMPKRLRAGTYNDMCYTGVGIANTDRTSSVVNINTSYDDVATNDLILVDTRQVTTTPPTGASVTLSFGST